MKTKKHTRTIVIELNGDKTKLKRMSVAQVIEMGKVIEDTLFPMQNYNEEEVDRIMALHPEMKLNLTPEEIDNEDY